MVINAVVPFEEGLAHYIVSPESNGIYQAKLVDFQGVAQKQPPKEVILVKGYRQWSGSYDRQELLNQIGSIIESRVRKGDPFS